MGLRDRRAGSGLWDGAIFVASFLLILALCFPLLTMPPVWDAAAGAFAPAIYLYQHPHGFLHLLTLPGYIQGGPNTHPSSLYTMFVAVSMGLFHGRPDRFLPFLHIVNVAAASLIVFFTYSNLRDRLGPGKAVLGAGALLLCPVFLVQAGYVYMEIPGALFSILCLHFWARGRERFAVSFALLALAVKAFGLVAIAALAALMILELALGRGSRKMLFNLCGMVVLATLFSAWRWHFETIPHVSMAYTDYLRSLSGYLILVPDLLVLVVLVPYALWLFVVRHSVASFPRSLAVMLQQDRFLLAALVFSVAFIGFMFTVPLSGKMFFPMPRYYVWALPALFFIFFAVGARLLAPLPAKSAHLALSALMILLIAFFVINRDGRLYPARQAPITSFSVLERSLEYLEYFTVQSEAARYVAANFPDQPVFVTRGERYFMSSPLMGYVSQPPADLRFVLSDRGRPVEGERFVIVDTDSNDFQGESVLRHLLRSLRADARFRVRLSDHRRAGAHYERVYEVTREAGAMAGAPE